MADRYIHAMPDCVLGVEDVLDRRVVCIDIGALYRTAYAAKQRYQTEVAHATQDAEDDGRSPEDDPAVLAALADLDFSTDLFLWLHDVR